MLMARCARMQAGPGVEQMGHEEQRIHRQNQDDRRQHLARQHQKPKAATAGVVARKRIGHGGGQRQSDCGRPDRRHDAVEEIRGEIVVDEDLDEIVEPKRRQFGRNPIGRQLIGERHPQQPDREATGSMPRRQ